MSSADDDTELRFDPFGVFEFEEEEKRKAKEKRKKLATEAEKIAAHTEAAEKAAVEKAAAEKAAAEKAAAEKAAADKEQEASPVDIAFEAYLRAEGLKEDSNDEDSVEESSAVQGTEDVSLNEVPAQLGASLAQSQGTEAVSSNEVAGVCLLVYHASLYTVM